MSLFEELKRRNVVRVAIAYSVTAWLVAQIAELAFDNFGAPDWVIKVLLFVLVMGLPFAIIFAWAYELTPDGLKREKDVDRSHSITPKTGRRIDYVIIGVLSAALIFAVSTHQWTDGVVGDAETEVVETTGRQSIAVLPFVNMSEDPGNEYFSDGISEELLNVLVKVQGLRVASRTSSFSFKGNTEISIPEIAERLGVDNVLEGSVRKAGNKVRITAQLIDVSTDAHLWSETYDRELDDIFAVQDEISLAIVSALASTLGTGGVPTQIPKHSTENVAAYEAYLRGRYLWQRRGDDIPKAVEMFEQAVELDPQFGRAWSSLAAAHITMPSYIFDASYDEHHGLARTYALKALEIDDSLAEAHAVLGELNRFAHAWQDAEQHYRAAIQSEPSSATAHLWYAEHLQSLGRIDDALIEAEIAHELDPLSPGTNSILISVMDSNGEAAAAVSYADSALTFGHPWGFFFLIEEHFRNETFDAARTHFEKHQQILPPDQIREDLFNLWIGAYEEGTPDAEDKYIDTMQQEFGSNAGFLVVDFVRFGRLDEAFAMIGSAEDYFGNAFFDFWRSDMGALRSDPRFAELITELGFVEYWDEYGWSSFCERADEQIRCH